MSESDFLNGKFLYKKGKRAVKLTKYPKELKNISYLKHYTSYENIINNYNDFVEEYDIIKSLNVYRQPNFITNFLREFRIRGSDIIDLLLNKENDLVILISDPYSDFINYEEIKKAFIKYKNLWTIGEGNKSKYSYILKINRDELKKIYKEKYYETIHMLKYIIENSKTLNRYKRIKINEEELVKEAFKPSRVNYVLTLDPDYDF